MMLSGFWSTPLSITTSRPPCVQHITRICAFACLTTTAIIDKDLVIHGRSVLSFSLRLFSWNLHSLAVGRCNLCVPSDCAPAGVWSWHLPQGYVFMCWMHEAADMSNVFLHYNSIICSLCKRFASMRQLFCAVMATVPVALHWKW